MNPKRLAAMLIAAICLSGGTARAGEEAPVTPPEYAVYTALLTLTPPGGIGTPQFFDELPTCRSLIGRTGTDARAQAEDFPGPAFGHVPADLLADFRHKNRQPATLAPDIPVKDLQLLPPDTRLPAEWDAAPARPGAGCLLTLSRVGFNGAQDSALFTADIRFTGGMQASYLLLMRQDGGKWSLVKVMATGMRIP